LKMVLNGNRDSNANALAQIKVTGMRIFQVRMRGGTESEIIL
jgi:hypothetical protein